MRTTVLAAAACVALLGGCGNKGDLYLPGDPAPESVRSATAEPSEDDRDRTPDEDQP
ncbi:MAG: lipoprotein [Pseudomonadota bacterium]